jgi:Flp pilus assembly pilin Flp
MTSDAMWEKAFSAQFKAKARRFASDFAGSTAIEYAVIAALIGAGVVGVVSVLGGTVADLCGSVLAKFTG